MSRSRIGKGPSGRADALPILSKVAFKNTSRLIQSKYSLNEASVLARLTTSDEVLTGLFDVESRTNDRLLAENGLLPGIGPHELVAAVPYASIINAAFCHARPDGARFNGPDRGAWYTTKNILTAQAEVSYHSTVALAETGVYEDEVTYDEYLADFKGAFQDLRVSPRVARALDPFSYKESQMLAHRLLLQGSLGVVYPSVRHQGGVCLACFRPSLVMNVRKRRTYRFRWSGKPQPFIELQADALRGP